MLVYPSLLGYRALVFQTSAISTWHRLPRVGGSTWHGVLTKPPGVRMWLETQVDMPVLVSSIDMKSRVQQARPEFPERAAPWQVLSVWVGPGENGEPESSGGCVPASPRSVSLWSPPSKAPLTKLRGCWGSYRSQRSQPGSSRRLSPGPPGREAVREAEDRHPGQKPEAAFCVTWWNVCPKRGEVYLILCGV